MCPIDSNLLASGGRGGEICIYDKRRSKIVRTIEIFMSRKTFFLLWIVLGYVLFNTNHLIGDINCVRWSPCGNMIASASDNQRQKLIDFRTERMEREPYFGYTPFEDNCKISSFITVSDLFYFFQSSLPNRPSSISMFYVDQDHERGRNNLSGINKT